MLLVIDLTGHLGKSRREGCSWREGDACTYYKLITTNSGSFVVIAYALFGISIHVFFV